MSLEKEIQKIQEILRNFSKERDWDKFHSPKNIAMALSVESSELVEIFQWKNEKESWDISQNKEDIEDELADIFLYLIRMSDILGINLEESTKRKILKNGAKYPANQVYGSSKKYNEY